MCIVSVGRSSQQLADLQTRLLNLPFLMELGRKTVLAQTLLSDNHINMH